MHWLIESGTIKYNANAMDDIVLCDGAKQHALKAGP